MFWLGGVLAFSMVDGAETASAYVWQRQPGPEVASAMAQFAPQLGEICVLAAEITWSNRGRSMVRVPLDYTALASVGCPIGLAVRVGLNPHGSVPGEEELAEISAFAGDAWTRAKVQGLKLMELQIDFDCPESKLAGYREWLGKLRITLAGIPLVITALPSWLKRPEFIALARTGDGFVLQVHSLEKPGRIEKLPILCDPARVREWIEQADKVGVNFRIALPTHGYLLGFDSAGNYLGVQAEGLRPDWPPGTRVRAVLADPVTIATMLRALRTAPPRHLQGVIWFRLPVVGDRLAWNAVTFATVLSGEIPQAHLSVAVAWAEPGLAEVSLVNDGQTTELLPDFVKLNGAQSGKMQAGDGLGGFRLDMRGGEVQGISRANGTMTDALLAPGRRMKIAWLRFPHDLPLEALVVSPP